MAMGMAGGVFGQAPLRLAIEASDWRTTMLLLAAGGVAILAVAAWATVRDKWHGSGGMAVALSGLGKVMRHRQTLLIALTGLGTSAPLLAFAGLWGVPFLETAYGMSRTSAAGVTSAFFAGWGIGAPLFGWLSDRIGRRRDPLLIALALKTVALAALIYVPGLPLSALIALSFLVGLFGSAQILCFALVKENHTPGAQRHGDRLSQRCRHRGRRSVSAARRRPARSGLDGRDSVRRPRLPGRSLSHRIGLTDRMLRRRVSVPACRARDLLPPAGVCPFMAVACVLAMLHRRCPTVHRVCVQQFGRGRPGTCSALLSAPFRHNTRECRSGRSAIVRRAAACCHNRVYWVAPVTALRSSGRPEARSGTDRARE